MDATNKAYLDRFCKEFEDVYARGNKGPWNPQDVALMKDFMKLKYYILVIDAMQNGEDYPGSEHMPDMRGYSYARGGQHRDSMGRYMSGHYWPMNQYPDDMASRRYYDTEKQNAIHKLHHMLETEENPDRKNALKLAVTVLEEDQ